MCYRMKSLVIVCLCVCMSGLFLGTAAVNADLVNGSFEAPALAENGYQSGVADNWSGWSFAGYVINGTNAAPDGFAGPSHLNQFQEYKGWIGQNTGIEMTPGYTYTLSGDVNPGNYSGTPLSALFSVEYADNSTTTDSTRFGYDTFTGFTQSTWANKSVSATYTGDPGKYLCVWVQMGGNYGGLDNLVVTVTPEPSVIVLLGAGLVGLLAYAWRKRR